MNDRGARGITPSSTICEWTIGRQEPPARRHAVRLVVEALRIELEELRRESRLHELGVQRGDAVDGVTSNDGEIRHPHFIAFDDGDALRHRRLAGESALDFSDESPVDLLD